MCESLADCLVERLEARPPVAVRKVRAPAVDDFWTRSSDWHLLFRSDWQRQEHQHVLELRTLVNLGRHVARSRKSWGRKHWVMTDSLGCLGALVKGRCSSPPLLRLLRRWASIRFGLDISFALRWVPSGKIDPTAPRGGPSWATIRPTTPCLWLRWSWPIEGMGHSRPLGARQAPRASPPGQRLRRSRSSGASRTVFGCDSRRGASRRGPMQPQRQLPLWLRWGQLAS